MSKWWTPDRDLVLIHGDNLEVMATFRADQADAIVCDPPYFIGFMNASWDSSRKISYYEFSLAWAREAYRVLKPGGHLVAFSSSRTYHRMACAIEDAGFEMRDCLEWIYGSGFPKSHNTALKPAHEPIALARKPLAEKTVAKNVLAHGTGALNIGGCRVGSEGGHRAPPGAGGDQSASVSAYGTGLNGVSSQVVEGMGRWPTNLVLTHSPQCEQADGTKQVKGNTPRPMRRGATTGTSIGGHGTYSTSAPHESVVGRADEAGFEASEDWDCVPECPVAELDQQRAGASALFPVFSYDEEDDYPLFLYQAKAAQKERPVVNGKRHTTVKPVALMQWLVRLVCPSGGIVLDPFAGTGTTGQAALREGCKAILIEQSDTDEHPYIRMARKRLGL